MASNHQPTMAKPKQKPPGEMCAHATGQSRPRLSPAAEWPQQRFGALPSLKKGFPYEALRRHES
eukprot:7272462-Prorocentrum_lima.AAC.1